MVDSKAKVEQINLLGAAISHSLHAPYSAEEQSKKYKECWILLPLRAPQELRRKG
jgi:hypothetical protein